MGTMERGGRPLRRQAAAAAATRGQGRGARVACRGGAGRRWWGGKNEERDSARGRVPASLNHLTSCALSLPTGTRERPIHLPKQAYGSKP